jgi:ribosome-binding protein aMBF1 (putative translation factor)
MASKTLRKTLRSRENDVLIELLVSAREKQGMTQRDLAAALKRPQSFVGRFEAGERRLDVVEFVGMVKALKLDPIDLFTRFVRSC